MIFKEKKQISKKLELNESPDYLMDNLFELNENRLAFQTCEISYLYMYNNKKRVKMVNGKEIDDEEINGSLGGILVLIFYSAIFSICFYASLIYTIKEKLFFFIIYILFSIIIINV